MKINHVHVTGGINGHKTAASITEASGISIGGWNGTGETMSSGVTKTGNQYAFAGTSQIDYIRIPYQGTIDPSNTASNVEMDITFQMNSITGANVGMLLSRYHQGSDVPSWSIAVSPAGELIFSYDNASLDLGASITFGTRNTVTIKRVAGVWTFYLNGKLINTLNYLTDSSATWDWVIGSYLDFTGNVIEANFVSRENWILYGLTVKTI